MQIDFVLPWVDGDEPHWKKIRAQYKNLQDDTRDAHADARFRDMETLRYTLRAIEKHCPWYHKIYLITEGHTPDWVDIAHDKIVLVPHEDLFINKSHLPVFNSVAIEMNLVNLKALSDTFVYMNDDFLIMNPLGPERFFKEGKPVDFFSHSIVPRNRLFGLVKKRDTWIHSINNVLSLYNRHFAPIQMDKSHLYHKSYTTADKLSNFFLDKIYRKLIWINHWHHPQPLLKQTLNEVYGAFKEEMMASSQNRFRDKSDLNQYMYRYWQLLTGNFYPYKHNDDLVANIDSIEVLDRMIETIETNRNINFVCFNDSTALTDEAFVKVKKRLTGFLENRFPHKASFER